MGNKAKNRRNETFRNKSIISGEFFAEYFYRTFFTRKEKENGKRTKHKNYSG